MVDEEDPAEPSHVFEAATSGRAKCRGCGQTITKGAIRFGERVANSYGDGLMSLWFHPACAAYKRPEPFLQTIDSTDIEIENIDALKSAAEAGIGHRRLPRVNGASRAPTGRASCRSCREVIEKGTWRIAVVYFEDTRFEPAGFIHAGCASDYFETTEILERAQYFSPDLENADWGEFQAAVK